MSNFNALFLWLNYFLCFKITQTVRHYVALTFSVHSTIVDFLLRNMCYILFSVTAGSRFSTLPSKIIKYYFVRDGDDEVIQYRVIPNLFRNLSQNRCWNKFSMTLLDCFAVHFFRLFGWLQKRGFAPRYGLGFRLRPTENLLLAVTVNKI